MKRPAFPTLIEILFCLFLLVQLYCGMAYHHWIGLIIFLLATGVSLGYKKFFKKSK